MEDMAWNDDERVLPPTARRIGSTTIVSVHESCGCFRTRLYLLALQPFVRTLEKKKCWADLLLLENMGRC